MEDVPAFISKNHNPIPNLTLTSLGSFPVLAIMLCWSVPATSTPVILAIHLIPTPPLKSCTLGNMHLYAGHTTFTPSGTQSLLLAWPPSFLVHKAPLSWTAQCSAGNPGASNCPGLLTLVRYASPGALAHTKASSRISPTLELKFPPCPPLGSCLPSLRGAAAALEPLDSSRQAQS